jgi:DNA-binding transcriptional regulator YhcF (GntR family)
MSKILISEIIVDHIERLIKEGTLELNALAPSINQIACEFKVANETVVKAYKQLKAKGVLSSIRGKGFFVAKTNLANLHHVLILFDEFSPYKETLYNNIRSAFGNKAILDIYFHHNKLQTFENLINTSLGKYTEYIILPYCNNDVSCLLNQLPQDNLYLLDFKIANFNAKGVFQDFENDVYHVFNSLPELNQKYQRYYFVYKNEVRQVVSLIDTGFSRFCTENQKEYIKTNNVGSLNIEKGDAFLVTHDDDLVELVLKAEENRLILGEDIGIVSYNETALKKIASGGISVISTDFAKMGTDMANLILDNRKEMKYNAFGFINRKSY